MKARTLMYDIGCIHLRIYKFHTCIEYDVDPPGGGGMDGAGPSGRSPASELNWAHLLLPPNSMGPDPIPHYASGWRRFDSRRVP